MLSSDKNVETIAQLIEAVKHYLGLQAEYVKLDVIDKVVRLLTHATLAIIIVAILALALVFASLGVAFLLAKSIGIVAALLVVAAAYAFLLLLIIAFRKPWIEHTLVRYMAKLLLS